MTAIYIILMVLIVIIFFVVSCLLGSAFRNAGCIALFLVVLWSIIMTVAFMFLLFKLIG